jgi:signal transduction histidine kinase/PAS domain-containing protein
VLLVAYELLHSLTYTADSIDIIISRMKWEMNIILIFFGLFPWFISKYTDFRPQWVLPGLTAVIVILIVVNSVQPYGLQFTNISSVKQVELPWGETVSQPEGRISVIFMLGIAAIVMILSYSVFALGIRYRRDRARTTLAMLFAMGLFMAMAIEAILVRLGVIDFISVGHLSILAMIIAMSMALSQEMQQKLRASEHRFRSLVEQSPFSLQVLSPHGRTVQVNRAWENLWGVTLEQIAKYNLLQDQQLRDKGIMPYLEKGFAGQAMDIPPVLYNPAENTVVKGPTRDRWIRGFIYPIKNEIGEVREVVVLHEDVTEKKRFDDAIHLIASGVSTETGEGFFQQLVQNLAELFATQYAFVGVLEAPDAHSVKTMAVFANGNPAPDLSYSLEGTPCAMVIGQATCIFPREVQQLFPQDKLLVDMGAESYVGTPLFDSKGAPLGIIVLIDSQPLRNAEQMKAIMEIVAARAAAEIERMHAEDLLRQQRSRLEDMVEQRTAELQTAIKELEAFSYSVSHDLRAPLRSIDGFSQALADDYANVLDVQGQDFLGRIRSNVQRMAILIDDLLKLSRVTQKEISKQPVNISQLVAQSIHKFQEQEPSRTIEVSIAENVFANGDPDLLTIAIDNLVSNAWKYTGKTNQPVVKFGVENQDKTPVYYIKDNGSGFDMQYAEKLFNAFQRLHSPNEFEGTGIGLAIVDRIIHRHGGRIWADAKVKNGAVFYFSLPD